jgi:hypothetical protein
MLYLRAILNYQIYLRQCVNRTQKDRTLNPLKSCSIAACSVFGRCLRCESVVCGPLNKGRGRRQSSLPPCLHLLTFPSIPPCKLLVSDSLRDCNSHTSEPKIADATCNNTRYDCVLHALCAWAACD